MTTDLILVPTQLELDILRAEIRESLPSTSIELCGFGPITSAARTATLICQYSPKRTWLVGIAGGVEGRVLVGESYLFDSVSCFGVGAGSGSKFESAAEMGWAHWAGPPQISDTLNLTDNSTAPRHLLTAMAASGSNEDVASRIALFPEYCAEDMEGFSVAVACKLLSMDLTIVRGISNIVGDRDHSNWQVNDAMRSASKMVSRLLNVISN